MKLKKILIGIISLSILTIFLTSCSSSSEKSGTTTPAAVSTKAISPNTAVKPAETPAIQPNKPLFTDIFYADPSAHVFNGKLYIYPSHDIDTGVKPDNDGSQYDMKDYHVLSIDDFNSSCIDNGEALNIKDVPWAKRQMWAPDAVYKNDKYYLYFPAKDKDDVFRIGVATSQSPIGPFTAEKNYIQGTFSIDPAVFTDSDNKSYIYFGGLMGGQLQDWKTGKFDKNGKLPGGSELALGPRVAELNDDMLSLKETQEISIVDENGKPLLAKDEDRRFFEGIWMHKYNGNYYLSYSTGTTHKIVYAMSKSPKGPFTFKGTILEPVKGWTTHHSIVEFNGKWYLFYHDASVSGVDNKRSVKYTELTYNSDGAINTITP
ncbi:MAG: glycoside hydrolase family 43 protein [Bacillota bacterium]|nr:glycoside hydrolase family 43 protein [Bacillota bacterium]